MQSQQPIRVLLVDDEEIIRYGLKAALQLENNVEVVGEACNGQEAIALAKQLRPDVILMDIRMPVLNGVSAAAQISQALPQTKVLILTTHTEDQYLTEALQQGATGYLLKNTPPQDFIHIIQATYRGYLQFSPSLSQKLSANLSTNLGNPPQPPSSFPPNASISKAQPAPKRSETSRTAESDWKGTTPREQEVIRLIAEGANNREIAQMLYITEKTVKNHVSNILNRTGMRNRTQLAIWANSSAQMV